MLHRIILREAEHGDEDGRERAGDGRGPGDTFDTGMQQEDPDAVADNIHDVGNGRDIQRRARLAEAATECSPCIADGKHRIGIG